MNKINSLKINLSVYLLLPVLPLLNLFVKNFYILSRREKFYLTYVIFAIYFIGFLLKFFESKGKFKLSKFYLIWGFLFFNYFTITNFAFSNFPPAITRIDNYAFYFYFLNFLFVSFLFIKFFEKEAFKVLLNVFVVVSIISTSYFFFSEIFKNRPQDFNTTTESMVDFKKYPDVYFIIFDNMANFKTLNNYYNFDTSAINSQLTDSNYHIYENSTSLYGQTRLSMSSILNLEYLYPEGEVPFSTRRQIVQSSLTTDSLVYSTFEKNNYELFIVGENFPCDNTKHYCINYKVNDGFLYNLLINTPYSILVNNRSSMPDLYKKINKFLRIDCSPDCKEITFEEILANIKENDDPLRPNLVLIHNNNSHKPFRLDSRCENLDSTKFEPAIYNQQEYIDANKCNVKELVFLKNNLKRETVIIAQSDHGPRYKNSVDTFSDLTKDDIQNKYTTFAAVYGHESICSQYSELIFYGVNTFRSLFNCLSEDSYYEYLIPRSFYASYGTQLGEINYGFNEIVDITEILKSLNTGS